MTEGPGDSYVVQAGDTLNRIAALASCTVTDLARWNSIAENAPLVEGQRLRLHAPIRSATRAGSAAVTPGLPAVAAAAAPVAAPAPEAVTEPVAEASAVALQSAAPVETHALEAVPGIVPGSESVAPAPSAAVPAPAAAPVPPAPAPAPAPDKPPGAPWVWPVDGRVVGTFDAQRSKGIEILATEDAQILAATDGEVSYTGSPRDYGNLVILRHPDGLLTVYAHAKSILVQQGQAVTRGQAVAVAGRTTGKVPSVHFEVRRKGVPVDPLELLPPRTERAAQPQ